MTDVDFLKTIVQGIVNNPDAVQVDRKVDELGVLLTLTVSPEDMGYIIGRSGRTAQALRTIMKIFGAKHDSRVNLKINEPEGGRGPRAAAPAPMPSLSDDIDTSAVDNLTI